MSSWRSASPHQKVELVLAAIADGHESAREIAEAVDAPSPGSITMLCKRREISLPNARKKAGVSVVSGVVQTRVQRQKQPFAFKLGFSKPPESVETSPELPRPGEGVSRSEALDQDACRYIIGAWERGEEPEMCGKPLTLQDKAKNFHFCESCQPHLINISAHTKARQNA